MSQGHGPVARRSIPPTGRGGKFPSHTHTHTSTHLSQEAGLPATGGANGDGAPQHRAIPLSTLDSFNGLSKNRVFEWNIKDYTVPRKKAESITILKDVGAYPGYLFACLPSPPSFHIPINPQHTNSHHRKQNKPLTAAGRAQNGTFNAIMGPSGCGKTSLLDCLALRNQTFTGALRLDGLPLTGSFFLNTGAWVNRAVLSVNYVSWCVYGPPTHPSIHPPDPHQPTAHPALPTTQRTGYVHQKELFFHYLTVREHLVFHAINRMSRIRTPQQCAERVEKVRAVRPASVSVCVCVYVQTE